MRAAQQAVAQKRAEEEAAAAKLAEEEAAAAAAAKFAEEQAAAAAAAKLAEEEAAAAAAKLAEEQAAAAAEAARLVQERMAEEAEAAAIAASKGKGQNIAQLRKKLDVAFAEGDFMLAATLSAEMEVRAIEVGIEPEVTREPEAEVDPADNLKSLLCPPDQRPLDIELDRLKKLRERYLLPRQRLLRLQQAQLDTKQKLLQQDVTGVGVEMHRLKAMQLAYENQIQCPPRHSSVTLASENQALKQRLDELGDRVRADTAEISKVDFLMQNYLDTRDALEHAEKLRLKSRDPDTSVLAERVDAMKAQKKALAATALSSADKTTNATSLLDAHCDSIVGVLEEQSLAHRLVNAERSSADVYNDALADRIDAVRAAQKRAEQDAGTSTASVLTQFTREEEKKRNAMLTEEEARAAATPDFSVLSLYTDQVALDVEEANRVQRLRPETGTLKELMEMALLDEMDARRAVQNAHDSRDSDVSLLKDYMRELATQRDIMATIMEEQTAARPAESFLRREIRTKRLAAAELRKALAEPKFNTLFYHPVSGTSLSAALYIKEKQLPYNLEVVDIMAGAQMADWFVALNPNHTVPTLATAEGKGVWESGAVLRLLAKEAGEELTDKVQTVLEWRQTTFYPTIGKVMYPTLGFGGDVATIPQGVKDIVENIEPMLEHFLEGKPFIGGDAPCVADFHIAPALNMLTPSVYWNVASSTVVSYLNAFKAAVPSYAVEGAMQDEFLASKRPAERADFDTLCDQKNKQEQHLCAADDRITELERLLAEEQAKRSQTIATLSTLNEKIDEHRAKRQEDFGIGAAPPPLVRAGSVQQRTGTLFHYPVSGNSLGAVLYITEKKLPYALEVMDIFSGAQMADWFVALNPNHTVPTLATAEGKGVWESGAILRLLAKEAGEELTDTVEMALAWRQTCLQPTLKELIQPCLFGGDAARIPEGVKKARALEPMLEVRDALRVLP